jgi:hypothetical protein
VLALPNILTPPASQTVTAGATATLAVSVTGGAPLRFAWRFNGCEIDGATNTTLMLTNVSTNNAGRYTVLISNPAGATSSPPATLNIQSPPVIVQQPQSRVVAAGTTTNFAVLVNGTPPLRYQWRFNGTNLAGATNAGITITNVQAPNEGSYTVIITNLYGSATSMVATLTINAVPVITAQPTNLVVFAGDTAAFAVTVTGSPPLRYQWRRNGNNLANATNSSLTIPNAQNVNAGNYTVVITNTIGSATSSVATLTVLAQPSITITATDASAAEAGLDPGVFTVTRSFVTNTPLAVNFTVSGSATAGSDYAALTSPVTIPANQPSATLSVTPVNDPTAEAPETVVVTLAAGTGYTLGSPAAAQVTLLDNDNLVPAVTITNPPSGTLYPVSPTNILLAATASDSDGTVARVEYFNVGTNKIGEATTPPYSVTWTNAPTGSNSVSAVATDNLGAQGVSTPVALLVNAPPTVSITSPSSGASFLAPANVTINANAADTDGSVTQVQFFVNSTNLVGLATSGPYSIEWTNVPIGSYSLTARAHDNRGASRVSAAVNITVANQLANLANNFTNRVTVGGFTNRVTGSNTGTSKEDGEPNHGSDQGGRSVWISWTAPAAGTAVADTLGSSFDTTLGVYLGSAINALTSVAQNNNISGGITQSRVTFTVNAGVTYHIAVDGNRFNGFTPTGAVTLSFGMPIQNIPPSITQQPISQTVAAGATANFNVAATGTAPLTYHWQFNGTALSGLKSAVLTLTNVTLAQQGGYSVIVSNAFGIATSETATLTVDDGLVTTRTSNLVPIHQPWRYNESGADLGTAWRAKAFNDSGWPEGAALLGFEPDNNYFEPMTTPLTPPQLGGPVTVYFRTRFQYTNTPGVMSLVASNFLDDGAIVYLNGAEVFRSALMPTGAVTYLTFTTLSVGIEGLTNVNTFPAGGLVPGENVLAVELHQSSSNSSDVVFGLALDALVTVTNQPVLVDARMIPGGSFEVTLEGVPGRRYAVERSPDLLTWSSWTTFTNVTGRTILTDATAPGNNPRFYRGRLVP